MAITTGLEYWVHCWAQTLAKSPGRFSNFLDPLFRRIDTFHSLSLLSNSIPQNPQDDELTSLYTAFHCCLDEALSRFSEDHWAPVEGTIFSELVNLLKENDATVRIMGVSSVMRLIDREIQKGGVKGTIPTRIMQALNDISVLAVGVRQTWSIYNFESLVTDRASTINELELKWEKRSRPWTSAAKNTLDALGGNKLRKLNVHIGNIANNEQQHLKFWTVVDQYMIQSSQTGDLQEIVDMVQQCAPIPITSSEDRLDHTMILHEPTQAPSLTQLQRSKSRKPQPFDTLVQDVQATKKPKSDNRIVLRLTKNREFWMRLFSENSSGLRMLRSLLREF
jgi:hypothetical protein